LIATLIEQIGEVDRLWQLDVARAIADRKMLIGDLVRLCEENPRAAEPHLQDLCSLKERTAAMYESLHADRQAILQEMRQAETQMRQLDSFETPIAASAPLLDRIG
jgi:hypothetical protein